MKIEEKLIHSLSKSPIDNDLSMFSPYPEEDTEQDAQPQSDVEMQTVSPSSQGTVPSFPPSPPVTPPHLIRKSNWHRNNKENTLRQSTRQNTSRNLTAQVPTSNSSPEFNPPNNTGYVPISTSRTSVSGILAATTTVKNVDVFEKLNLILTTDGFRHITGAKAEMADLSRGFELGPKWGELLLAFLQNMYELNGKMTFPEGWEISSHWDEE